MPLVPGPDSGATPLVLVTSDDLPTWGGTQPPAVQAWIAANGFDAALGSALVLPGADGTVETVLVGWGSAKSRARGRFHLAAAMGQLPAGSYAIVPPGTDFDAETEALGWLLSEYRFERYRKAGPATRRDLICPDGVDPARLAIEAAAATLCQDLINIPANDLGPADLERAFLELAEGQGARRG